MRQIKTTKMFVNRPLFFVKEQVGMFKFNGKYDIFDPSTKEQIGVATEDPGGLVHVLRFLINKKMLPTKVIVQDLISQQQAMRLQKSGGIFNFQVSVFDAEDKLVGSFRNKLLSFQGSMTVHDDQGNKVGDVRGNWKNWEYKFLDAQGTEMGLVTKKWAGIGKELFTTADNYIVSISPDAKNNREEYGMLLLAAALSYDVIFKEGK